MMRLRGHDPTVSLGEPVLCTLTSVHTALMQSGRGFLGLFQTQHYLAVN